MSGLTVPSLPPLIPGVKGSLYRRDDPRAEDSREEFGEIRMKVLMRDNFTCVYCGIRTQGNLEAPPHTLEASGGLHVHHIDDNHTINTWQNLITVCPLCHMVHHIGFAAHRGYVSYIYLPGMSQEHLNIMTHCVAAAQAAPGTGRQLGHGAWELYNSLLEFKRYVPLGSGINADATTLGTALAGMLREFPAEYAQRHKALSGVRVLFDYKKINLENFTAAQGWLPGSSWEDSWQRIYEDMMKTVVGHE